MCCQIDKSFKHPRNTKRRNVLFSGELLLQHLHRFLHRKILQSLGVKQTFQDSFPDLLFGWHTGNNIHTSRWARVCFGLLCFPISMSTKGQMKMGMSVLVIAFWLTFTNFFFVLDKSPIHHTGKTQAKCFLDRQKFTLFMWQPSDFSLWKWKEK